MSYRVHTGLVVGHATGAGPLNPPIWGTLSWPELENLNYFYGKSFSA
jgi:hypothetical protein